MLAEGRTLAAAADNYYEYLRGETVNLSGRAQGPSLL